MIKNFPDSEKMNRFAADKIIEIAAAAQRANGIFTIALAGGSTPKSLYQLLAGDAYKNKIDWTKTRFFFGDERNVSPDDEQSNFRMARETLFQPLNIADENVFRWKTELPDAARAAVDYEKSVTEIFDLTERTFPRFDAVLLGMGDDGHTASLFPFTEALNETGKIAVANTVKKLEQTRLTLTFPVINQARNVIFLVRGSDKATTLKTVLEGEFEPEKYPAQRVKPEKGELFWLLDREAAALLSR